MLVLELGGREGGREVNGEKGRGEGGRWVERETGEGRKGRSREGGKGWPGRQAGLVAETNFVVCSYGIFQPGLPG